MVPDVMAGWAPGWLGSPTRFVPRPVARGTTHGTALQLASRAERLSDSNPRTSGVVLLKMSGPGGSTVTPPHKSEEITPKTWPHLLLLQVNTAYNQPFTRVLSRGDSR